MNTNQGWNARSRIMESLSKNIYSTNKTFKKPSGVVSIEVEKNTVPLMLPSETTPENMIIKELFKDSTTHESTELVVAEEDKKEEFMGCPIEINDKIATDFYVCEII